MPISPELRHYYRTAEWRAARTLVIERARSCCESCGRPNAVRVLVGRGDPLGRWFDEIGIRWRAPLHFRGEKIEIAVNPPPTMYPLQVSLTQLGVAHLDHDPRNNDLNNLALFCRRCHLAYDRRHHMATARLRRDRETGQLRLVLAA